LRKDVKEELLRIMVSFGPIDPLEEHRLLLNVIWLVNEYPPQQFYVFDAELDTGSLQQELDLV
jgi:hypothetical protein